VRRGGGGKMASNVRTGTAGYRRQPSRAVYRRQPSRAVYRRRRLVALAALVLTLAGLFTLLAPDSGAQPSHEPPSLVVVVGEGETVLGVVRPHTPQGEDARAYAARVLDGAGLDARTVRPGTVLRLPRS
jgi:hypothetical protein